MKDKSMKKSVAILCMGLILSGSVVTGCSLVTRNYNNYYNAVAARIEYKDGSKIEITRKELLTAYNQYSFSQYVDNGYTEDESYEKCMDYLVSKKLAIRDAENKSRQINADDAILTSQEKTYLWEKTYDALMSNVDSYLNEEESEDDDETNADAITREVFERECDLVYNSETGKYSLKLPDSEKTDFESHDFWSENKDTETEAGKQEIFDAVVEYSQEGGSSVKDAYQEYFKILKSSEKELNLSTDAKSVFFREIDRVYGILYDSYMVSKYEDFICNNENNNVVISQMLDLYANKVRKDYTTYHGVDQVDDVKDNTGDIYYFNEGINWFYVTQILIKFDDTEQELYDSYTEEIEKIDNGEEVNSDKREEYEDKIDNLYKNLVGIKRVETEENVFEEVDGVNASNASKVFEEIVEKVNDQKTNTEKIQKFDDLIYVYNEDDGIMNSTYNYIVGIDYTKATFEEGEKVSDYTVYSNWVDEFNEAAAGVYNHGNCQIGDIYGVDSNGNMLTDDDGNYVGMVRTSYGIHILMYAGEEGNLFEGIDQNFTLDEEDILVLYNAKLNESTEKTYFDLMYEECVPEESSIAQSIDLNRLKSETDSITYFPKNFK